MIKSQSKGTLCVKLSASIAAVGVLLISGAASAQTAPADLAVGATVASNCTISTAPVAFGAYDPIVGLQLDVEGTVNVTCTTGSPVAVTLGQGLNADTGSTAAAPLRRMEQVGVGTAMLSYNLFTATGRVAVWGNTVDTDVETTGTGAAVPLTVFGRLAAGQNVPVGTYSDTVVATVTF